MRASRKRELTPHVVSRRYRAPEVIAMECYYDHAVDVWSLGCILAEILMHLEGAAYKKSTLFKGDSCYPLSPESGEASCESVKNNNSSERARTRDQTS